MLQPNDQGTVTPNTQADAEPITFNPATIREFTPSNPAGFQTYESTHAQNVSPAINCGDMIASNGSLDWR